MALQSGVFIFAEYRGARDNLAFDANGKLYGVTVDDHAFQCQNNSAAIIV